MTQMSAIKPAITKKALRASVTIVWASTSLMLHFPPGAVRWVAGLVTLPPGMPVFVMPYPLSTP
jgi:hypothetical protein